MIQSPHFSCRKTRLIGFTHQGWAILSIALILALSAVNSGNNMLYFILSFILATILLSGQTSWQGLRSLKVQIKLKSPLYARRLTKITLELENTHFMYPLTQISFTQTWERVNLQNEKKDEFTGSYFPTHSLIGPKENRRFSCAWTFPKRGRYRLGELSIQTNGPFGWFEREAVLRPGLEVLVLPSKWNGLAVEYILRRLNKGESGYFTIRGDHFSGLRPYLFGDDFRYIHWKKSARNDGFLVKTAREGGHGQDWIILDRRMKEDELDLALSFLSEVINFFLEGSLRFGIFSQGFRYEPHGSPPDLEPLHEFLALCEPTSTPLHLPPHVNQGLVVTAHVHDFAETLNWLVIPTAFIRKLHHRTHL